MNNPLEIAKNMKITHNVTFRVIDKGTNKVVREYTGHNMATNSMVLGVGYFLAGGGELDPNAIYRNFIPKYISLGTMGLINQDEDENGLPTGIGGANSQIVVNPTTGEETQESIVSRYTAYMNEAPGYGADGYGDNPATYNNNRPNYGLGPVYDTQSYQGVPIKCELISNTFPRVKIAYSNVINEENAQTPQTVDVVVSAMISTGALAQFRNGADHIFITEAGLWSTNKYSSSGKGLLAGYRIKPPNDVNWDMVSAENRTLLQENIIRVGINQVVQVVWKIQIGSVARLNLSDGSYAVLKSLVEGTGANLVLPYGITRIGPEVFYSDRVLTQINIPQTVTTIGHGAFMGCSNLTSVVWRSGALTTIEYSAFESCRMWEIVIPSSVTTIGNYAFKNCTHLLHVYLYHGLTTIGQYAFENCNIYQEIHIPDTVTSIGDGAFAGNDDLTTIYINKPEGSISVPEDKWGATNAEIVWNHA